jgi:hypothetical protein
MIWLEVVVVMRRRVKMRGGERRWIVGIKRG